jgi:hypothetical protein
LKKSIFAEQPDPRRFHPHRLAGERLPHLGVLPYRALDIAKIVAIARPRLAALGPLLAALGAAFFLRATRFAFDIAIAFDVGIARFGV